jgi:hypothetical protein
MKNSKITKMGIFAVFAASQVLLGTGCDSTNFGAPVGSTASSASLSNSSALASSVSLNVTGSGGNVYSDASDPGQVMTMTVGQSYTFHADASNLAAGATLKLSLLDTDIVNGTPIVITLQPGASQTIVAPSPGGDYLMTLTINSGGTVAVKNYQAAIGCSDPTFVQSVLNSNGLTVTGSNNMYTYNASGVIANPQNYLCGFDLSGTGILSSVYVPCNTSLPNMYVNDVGARNIQVIVKDTCNNSLTVNSSQTLAFTTPTPAAGAQYIYGVVTPTSYPASETRVNGVTYLATNASTGMLNAPVQANFAPGSPGQFTITSTFTTGEYNNGQPSTIPYGMSLNIVGITGSLNMSGANPSSTLNFSNMSVDSGSFTTDQSSDVKAQISLASAAGQNQCTGTHLNGMATPSAGTPCGSGTTGDQNSAIVEVWGDYTCNMTGAGGATATISGSFAGSYTLHDSCVGGGQGGGGITPISF